MTELELLRRSVRWQMRRGLLELDLLLTRFIASGEFDKLNATQLQTLKDILMWQDQDFLQIVHQLKTINHPLQQDVIAKIILHGSVEKQ